ncbi:MAG: class I SAM-dependent methyltransferase [Chloroflexi bacterium]|nr:class I SAM-dependent methyltransferase [Chloroflexota bacterium]
MEKTAAQRFSETADGYARTMAPSLRRMADEVVRRAELGPGDRVLDLGTGTGTAAAMARGDGRMVVGVDAAPGMLAIARREVDGVEFVESDFAALPFDAGAFDVVIAVHALLFAADQRATLAEWVRVTRPGGRLSLSVPGPAEVSPTALYGEIYERYGIDTTARYPTSDALASVARGAGWIEVEVSADPTTGILLETEAEYRTWRDIGSRGAATADFAPEQNAALTEEMLAVTPRTDDGGFRIPFGTLYLAARAPDG